jgi:hypothetical protein
MEKERRNQYFKELLNGKEQNDEVDNRTKTNEEYQDSQEGTLVPTADELEDTIDKLKNNKATVANLY